MTAMFLLFSNGSVLDLLLRMTQEKKGHKRKRKKSDDELDEIKDGHTVADWTQQAASIWSEEDVSLSVYGATYV